MSVEALEANDRHEIDRAIRRLTRATQGVWGPSTAVYIDTLKRRLAGNDLALLKLLLQNLADAVESRRRVGLPIE